MGERERIRKSINKDLASNCSFAAANTLHVVSRDAYLNSFVADSLKYVQVDAFGQYKCKIISPREESLAKNVKPGGEAQNA
jgi:hypothetical protein